MRGEQIYWAMRLRRKYEATREATRANHTDNGLRSDLYDEWVAAYAASMTSMAYGWSWIARAPS